MVAIVDWPFRTLKPIEIGLDHAWLTRDGGQGLNGVTQIVSPLSSLWEMSIVLALGREETTRTYRATKMRLMGRYNHCRFPIFDPWRVRFADAGWPEPMPDGIPFSDGSFFSDGSGFASPDLDTEVSLAAAAGASEIRLEVASIGDALSGGHFFSIDDFLYMVVEVGAKVGNNRTFAIMPSLRVAVAVGDLVRIGRPMLRCRLTDDRSGAIRMKLGRLGEPSMEFIEVLERE